MHSARSDASDTVERTAHEYLRVSVDGSGVGDSQSAQHDDNERSRERFGWRRGRTYKDTGSASRYARKARGDFQRLLADLDSGGVFGSGDVLQLWESSRGSREQVEWATFLNLLRDRGILLHVTSHDRVYDLNNPRDRRSLDEDGVDSAYESAKNSLRVQRHMAANASKGRPHGRVPFGYRRVYDPETGRLVTQVPQEGEAEIVQELFARLAQRHSLRSIARDFAACGILNHSGRPFSEQHLRRLALNATYAGLRVHDTTHQGRKPGQTMVTEGTWDALVDPQRFNVVQKFLSASDRRTKPADRPGRAVHEFSMIVVCGVCGGPLVVRNTHSRGRGLPRYFCRSKGCVAVDKAELDGFATEAILTALRSPELYEVLQPKEAANEADLSEVRTQLATQRRQYDELVESVTSGALSSLFAAKAEPTILAKIDELRTRERELLTPSVLKELIQPGKDVAIRWKDAKVSTRREVARLLFSPAVLGQLRIVHSPTRGGGRRCPVEQRVQWWKP